MKTNGVKLDERDLRIIEILQREGRLSKSELARRVHLSSTPCWERLRHLEDAGIIEGYEARVSLKAFGPLTQVVVTVELESHLPADFARFERAIQDHPEIHECDSLGGGIDYILKVLARDLESYQAFMDQLLSAGLGIRRYFTYVVTKPVKRSPPPVTRLTGPEGRKISP
ncbi:Lrp/AsnC family transcriptional regulator [Roseospira marina]|uniref:Lrp/AsnC family transcriptional regulator n=1 Tax=Roseospira marina TaxID=140057 RepID=A0A5M6IDB1_9PROT|nr:Lrp/AsnC family transcriptional regulator [Roseospira marina]KAA5605947.1 Lrp/AsnC family transcriptional regulator [Roseospira marina]MBB4313207.1 Lrp/AsnC family transcriptional regulator of ectoine degradation [Roseospira marina]MBB5086052.1 Lrp/AsnC family transcriptional regulator of ectoine degradation [Roseospira marina]